MRRRLTEQQVDGTGEDLSSGAVAMVGGKEVLADCHAEGEQAAGLDLVGMRSGCRGG